MPTRTIEEVRALFPSADEWTCLNHAGISPLSRPVADAVAAAAADLMGGDPMPAFKKHSARQEGLRAALGRMMGVDASTLGFVRNTSHGLAIAAQSIPLQPDDRIVIAAIEYPANVYPWLAQQYRGATVVRVPAREDGSVAEDDLLAAAGHPKTKVLAVSWVQWCTGQRMDLARLGAFCRERGIYFVVDMVQALGALTIDLDALGVDIAAAGGHKWLMAPPGIGVLYVRQGLLPDLLPTNVGSNSVTNPLDWEHIRWQDLKTTADRFEEGSPGFLAIASLAASVEVLESPGFDAVERHVLGLADRTREMLRETGCRVVSPDAPAQRSAIVCFRHPTLSNEAVLAALTERKVLATIRGGAVRLSPHIENNDADLEKALDAL